MDIIRYYSRLLLFLVLSLGFNRIPIHRTRSSLVGLSSSHGKLVRLHGFSHGQMNKLFESQTNMGTEKTTDGKKGMCGDRRKGLERSDGQTCSHPSETSRAYVVSKHEADSSDSSQKAQDPELDWPRSTYMLYSRRFRILKAIMAGDGIKAVERLME